MQFKIKNLKLKISTEKQGFSVVEALLAGSLFILIVSAFIGAVIYGEESTATAGNAARGAGITEEGLEAARNIRDGGFANLTAGNHGLAVSGGQWIFSGTSDVVNIFTREINVALNSLGSGSRSITASSAWTATPTRNVSTSIFSYLTNWRGCRGGMLVYANGGTTSDDMRYRILKGNDASDCTWSTPAAAADIDAGTTNRRARAVQVYPSATRNEKVMLSRHYDGLTQYIYGQVWNGDTSTWGNVQLMSSWLLGTFLDVQNFSGTYLANGDFMAVYSDNSTTPKFRTWNGTAWSSEVSTQSIGGIPNYIVAKARPGTSEVMAAFFDQSSDTNTQYFNGGTYSNGSWTLHTEHASAAPVNTEELVDFAWSPNNSLKGGLIYADSGSDKSLDIKIWTANGSGSGSWSSVANTTNQSNNIGQLAIVGRPGADEFIACDEDDRNPPRLICYKSNFTPGWTNPTNPTLTTNSDTGIQRDFHVGIESVSGDPAIAVYSDQTSTPKLKKYTASTSTWDSGATSLSALGAALETVRVIPYPNTDEIMIALADTNQDLYTTVWDGANNTAYTTPAGYAFSSHGTNGSSDTDFWFDFAWDQF